MLNIQKKLLRVIYVITVICVVLFVYCGVVIVVATPIFNETAQAMTVEESTEAQIVLIDTPITFADCNYKVFYDIELGNKYIAELQGHIEVLDAAMCPNEYTENAIAVMNSEKTRLQAIIADVRRDVEQYARWEQEYYYAAKTYEFLMQNGYSQEVACGIIGNMMVETSGGTLDLKPTIYSPGGSFYGLCQWSKSRKPKSADGSDASFEVQLVYLHEDIPGQFKAFGKVFKTSHESFLAIKDPAKAALIFAKVYERCDSSSYSARQRAANIAYKYFTSEA